MFLIVFDFRRFSTLYLQKFLNRIFSLFKNDFTFMNLHSSNRERQYH